MKDPENAITRHGQDAPPAEPQSINPPLNEPACDGEQISGQLDQFGRATAVRPSAISNSTKSSPRRPRSAIGPTTM